MAQDVAGAAQALLDRLDGQQARLWQEIDQVQQALHQLTAAQRADLTTDTGPQGTYIAPAGVAGEAMRIALAQRGKAYLWGGAGPDRFDCSGLILYSYAQAGRPGIRPRCNRVSASRSPGRTCCRATSCSSAVPHTGAVVRVAPLFNDYSGARRLSG